VSASGLRQPSRRTTGGGSLLTYAAAVLLLLIVLLVVAAQVLHIAPAALAGFPVIGLAVTALVLLVVAAHGRPTRRPRREFGQDGLEFPGVQQRLMSNISHELRTPLNVTLGYSEMLRDGVLGELTEQQVDAAREAHEAGQRILRIITDILDVGRARSYVLPSDPEPIAPRELVERVQLLLVGQARAAKVSLEVEVPDSLPSVEADERRFKQVVYHLALSSIIRSSEGDAIQIRAEPSGEFLLLNIADHGPQMSDTDIAAVFEQAPASVAEEGASAPNAVGLPLCVALTKDLGGRLDITSNPLTTTFTVGLPISA